MGTDFHTLPSFDGHQMSRHLRRVVSRGTAGQRIRETFQNVQYHPLEKGFVKTVEIYLKLGEDRDVLFRSGGIASVPTTNGERCMTTQKERKISTCICLTLPVWGRTLITVPAGSRSCC